MMKYFNGLLSFGAAYLTQAIQGCAFFSAKALLLLASVMVFVSSPASAKNLPAPQDPTQTIQYWKPHVIASDADPSVAKAHKIFAKLLGAWDLSRVEPDLFVVSSSSGPWAASLSDGNILLSESAVTTCFSLGEERGEHLLAFVLAHELAHQHSDDLWHQKFFRMAGTHNPDIQKSLVAGLTLDQSQQLEGVEAQADHDGVMLMASVGFDPARILEGQDFYTLWVESIWKKSCTEANNHVCDQAKTRALRTQTQLQAVINQSVLYELGVQAMVAGQFETAREYFLEFGKDYPSRVVHNAIAMTYLMSAVELGPLVAAETQKPELHLPLFLESAFDLQIFKEKSQAIARRGDSVKGIVKRQEQLVTKAIQYFEKALRLQPHHKATYLNMINGYLLVNNPFMARGILQGKYIPQFSNDSSAELFLALIARVEGKDKEARAKLESLNAKLMGLSRESYDEPLSMELLNYSVHANLSRIYLSQNAEQQNQLLWRNYAKQMQKQGAGLHFQLALQHLNKTPAKAKSVVPAKVGNYRIGDHLVLDSTDTSGKGVDPNRRIWMQGEPLEFIHDDQGRRYVVSESREIRSLWQDAEGQDQTLNLGGEHLQLKVGDGSDRTLKVLGFPSREMALVSGRYLAYDELGLGIKIQDQRIAGWFLYE